MAARVDRSMARPSGGAAGQAMVEFIIAIFAVVMIVAGLTEFVVLASRRSEIYANLRGRVGGRAVLASASDENAVMPGGEGAMPVPETSEEALAPYLIHERDGGKVELSKAMREWVFYGSRDSISVQDEVWMPPLEIGGAE